MEIEEFLIKTNKNRCKISTILDSGQYDEINYLIRQGIKNRKILKTSQKNSLNKIVLLKFADRCSPEKPLAVARKLGLINATYEDAFLFGEQHPEEQKKTAIVFLLEKKYLYSGHLFDLVLDSRKKGRAISLFSGHKTGSCRFAFIRKQTHKVNFTSRS